jgi:hypothetical protein
VPYEVVYEDGLENKPLLKIQSSGQSALSKTLAKLIRQKTNFDPYRDLVKVNPFEDDTQSEYFTSASLSIDTAHQRCQEIILNGMTCKVIIN